MPDFTDALGLGALLPGPAEWAPSGTTASLGDFSTGGSVEVPLRPPAAAPPAAGPAPPLALGPPAPAAGGGIDPSQILGMLRPQQPQGGVLNPNSQFMAALGAGLSSAGQNWNKPALAAFASGAGAALQGGQQRNNQQQDAKLKALHAAIAAWKTGDMVGYRQALINLRTAGAPAPAPAAPPPGPAAAPAATPPSGEPPPSPAAPPLAAPVVLALARDAIARGAPCEAVIKRLRERGIDPTGL